MVIIIPRKYREGVNAAKASYVSSPSPLGDLFFYNLFMQVRTTRVGGVEFAARGRGGWWWWWWWYGWTRRRAQIEQETDDGPRALPRRDATVRASPFTPSPLLTLSSSGTFGKNYSGIIRAVNASHFGAPQDAAAAGAHSHSSSSSSSSSLSLHEDTLAGSTHLAALHSLLRHHHHHHHVDEAPMSGAGGSVGVGDSGSDTASIIDVSAGMSATPEERQHRHPHLGRLKQLVRRQGDDN